MQYVRLAVERDDVLVARYIDEAYGGHGTTRLLGLRFGAGTQEPS